MAERVKVAIFESWTEKSEKDSKGPLLGKSRPYAETFIDRAPVDAMRAAAAEAVRVKTGGKAASISFHTDGTVVANIRR